MYTECYYSRLIFNLIARSSVWLTALDIWNPLQVYSPLSFLETLFIAKPSAVFEYLCSLLDSEAKMTDLGKQNY